MFERDACVSSTHTVTGVSLYIFFSLHILNQCDYRRMPAVAIWYATGVPTFVYGSTYDVVIWHTSHEHMQNRIFSFLLRQFKILNTSQKKKFAGINVRAPPTATVTVLKWIYKLLWTEGERKKKSKKKKQNCDPGPMSIISFVLMLTQPETHEKIFKMKTV